MSRKVDAPCKRTGCNQHLKKCKEEYLLLHANDTVRFTTLGVINTDLKGHELPLSTFHMLYDNEVLYFDISQNVYVNYSTLPTCSPYLATRHYSMGGV